eukprot:scaffold332_cov105-Isochrysis_galbana.AAC.5
MGLSSEDSSSRNADDSSRTGTRLIRGDGAHEDREEPAAKERGDGSPPDSMVARGDSRGPPAAVVAAARCDMRGDVFRGGGQVEPAANTVDSCRSKTGGLIGGGGRSSVEAIGGGGRLSAGADVPSAVSAALLRVKGMAGLRLALAARSIAIGSAPVLADRSSVAASHTFSDDTLQKAAGGSTAFRMPALAPGVKGEQCPVESRFPEPMPKGRVEAESALCPALVDRAPTSSSEGVLTIGGASCWGRNAPPPEEPPPPPSPPSESVSPSALAVPGLSATADDVPPAPAEVSGGAAAVATRTGVVSIAEQLAAACDPTSSVHALSDNRRHDSTSAASSAERAIAASLRGLRGLLGRHGLFLPLGRRVRFGLPHPFRRLAPHTFSNLGALGLRCQTLALRFCLAPLLLPPLGLSRRPLDLCLDLLLRPSLLLLLSRLAGLLPPDCRRQLAPPRLALAPQTLLLVPLPCPPLLLHLARRGCRLRPSCRREGRLAHRRAPRVLLHALVRPRHNRAAARFRLARACLSDLILGHARSPRLLRLLCARVPAPRTLLEHTGGFTHHRVQRQRRHNRRLTVAPQGRAAHLVGRLVRAHAVNRARRPLALHSRLPCPRGGIHRLCTSRSTARGPPVGAPWEIDVARAPILLDVDGRLALSEGRQASAARAGEGWHRHRLHWDVLHGQEMVRSGHTVQSYTGRTACRSRGDVRRGPARRICAAHARRAAGPAQRHPGRAQALAHKLLPLLRHAGVQRRHLCRRASRSGAAVLHALTGSLKAVDLATQRIRPGLVRMRLLLCPALGRTLHE